MQRTRTTDHPLTRRRFLTRAAAATAATVASPSIALGAIPQGAARRVAIAFPLGSPSEVRSAPFVSAFLAELARLGLREGEDVAVTIATGNGELGGYAAFAQRVVAERPDLILAFTAQVSLKMKAATDEIPIIACATDLAGNGLFGHPPGLPGNVTGVDVNGGTGLYAARLELMRKAGLNFIKPAFLTPNLVDLRSRVNELRPIWKNLIPVQVSDPIGEATLRIAFKAMIEEGADALLVSNSPFLAHFPYLVTKLAREYRLPSVYPYSAYVDAGGLMSYGMDFKDLGRAAAAQALKIFNGTPPGDIPVYVSTKYETGVNLRMARSLNVTLARAVVSQADVVIE